jgi:hypothetical protein
MSSSDPSFEVFPSKIDPWLVLLLVAAWGVSLVSVVSAVKGGGPPSVLYSTVGLEVFVFGFVVWVFTTTRYTVGGGALAVRSGPFRWRIALEEISEIVPSRNPLSSPALSLDRLEVRYGRGRLLLISPRERQSFLAAVVARAPGLTLAGERVRRRAP